MKGTNKVVLCEEALAELLTPWAEKSFGPDAQIDSITYDYSGYKITIKPKNEAGAVKLVEEAA